MVTSVLHGNAALARDVADELEAMTSPQKTAARNALIVVGSLLLFVLLAWGTEPAALLLLVVALLIHELGHLIAMKAFGYRDVQLFFIPFFGAAVAGLETNPSGTRRAIVSLSGPFPGIVIGIVCTLLFHATGMEWFKHGARMFLLLNAFNLLPFVPLDGGRYLEAVLFARRPILRALSDVLAVVALAALAYLLRSIVLGFVAFVVLRSVRLTYFQTKVARDIKRDLSAEAVTQAVTLESAGTPSVARDRIPADYVERLIPLVELHLPEAARTPKAIAATLRNIWNLVWFTPPSARAAAGLVVVYLVCLITGIVATLIAELSFAAAAGPAAQ